MIGRHMVERPNAYAQVVICAMVATTQLPGMCEPLTAGMVGVLNQVAPMLREWVPVITIIRFTGMRGPNAKAEDTPHRHPPEEALEPSSISGLGPGSHRTSDSFGSGGSAPIPQSPSWQQLERKTASDSGTRSATVSRPSASTYATAASKRVSRGRSESRSKSRERDASGRFATTTKSAASGSTIRPRMQSPLSIESTSKPPVDTDSEDEEPVVAAPTPKRLTRPTREIEPPPIIENSSSSGSTRRLSLVDSVNAQKALQRNSAGNIRQASRKGSDGNGSSAGTVATSATRAMPAHNMSI